MIRTAHHRLDPDRSSGATGHFLMLDALRGVAALMVVGLHATHAIDRGPFSHAYLAVDFFFMLSGFVLSHAYDPRFAAGMGTIDFMRRRLRRLWPTMAVGILLGAAATWGRGASVDLLLPVLLSELLFVPVGKGSVDLFVLNGVQWSLLLELLANVVHARGFRWASVRALIAIVAISVVALIALAWVYGGLRVGYNGTTLPGGIARIAASYAAGMLIYRLWSRAGQPRGTVPGRYAVAGLIVALIVPGLLPSGWWVDPAVVIFVFPSILWLGAIAQVAPRWRPGARFAGEISYPLYAFHVPVLALGALLGKGPGVTAAAVVVAIVFAAVWARANFSLAWRTRVPAVAFSRAVSSRR